MSCRVNGLVLVSTKATEVTVDASATWTFAEFDSPSKQKLSILSAILAYPNIPPLTLIPAGGSEIFLLPTKRLIRPAIMEFRR